MSNKKKNKTPQRKRIQMLKVDLSEKDVNPETGLIEINLEFNEVANTAKVINAKTNKVINNASLVFGYQGENKFRITSELKTEPNDHSFCFNCKFDRYKHIVSIDTNIAPFHFKRLNQNFTIGLGFAILLNQGDADNIALMPIQTPFITEIDSPKPENENWIRVIELLRNNCQCSDPRKIGIVVDSDKGNIDSYNSRKLPIYGNYYLPENFEIIFASDKVSDNIFNKMIKESHKLSQMFLPRLISHIQKQDTQ